MKCWTMLVCWLIALSPSAVADEQSLIQTDQQMVSYTLGYQIGGQLAAQIHEGGLDLDPEAFARAIADGHLLLQLALWGGVANMRSYRVV